VETVSGRRPGFSTAFARTALLFVLPWVALWCLLDRDGAGLHDRLTGTRVVRDRLSTADSPM
jgi:uncharacterized RDD family membrane protein YckC